MTKTFVSVTITYHLKAEVKPLLGQFAYSIDITKELKLTSLALSRKRLIRYVGK